MRHGMALSLLMILVASADLAGAQGPANDPYALIIRPERPPVHIPFNYYTADLVARDLVARDLTARYLMAGNAIVGMPAEYRIRHHDKLLISWKSDPLPVHVRSDGTIYLPLIDGVPAVNLTASELGVVLADKFKLFMPSPPDISVIVVDQQSVRP